MKLAQFTTLSVGGIGMSVTHLERAHEFYSAAQIDSRFRSGHILGGGSNVVISDNPLAEALVIIRSQSRVNLPPVDAEGTVTFDAAEPWSDVADALVLAGLKSVENLVGIPGTVGGAVVQNIGAYGSELSSVVHSVTVYDREDNETLCLTAEECDFSYRNSLFKGSTSPRFVVMSLRLHVQFGASHVPNYDELAEVLELRDGPRPHGYSISSVRSAVLSLRASKNMIFDASDGESRGVGSFFVNPLVSVDEIPRIAAATPCAVEDVPHYPVDAASNNGNSQRWPVLTKVPAAWLIENAGFLKGYRSGRIGLACGHALSIVNATGAGLAEEILELASQIRAAVQTKFGVSLDLEPILLGFSPKELDKYSLGSLAT